MRSPRACWCRTGTFPISGFRRFNTDPAYPVVRWLPESGLEAGYAKLRRCHMSFNTYTPPGWWDRAGMLGYAFIAGMLVGGLFGWFFHRVIPVARPCGVVCVSLV